MQAEQILTLRKQFLHSLYIVKFASYVLAEDIGKCVCKPGTWELLL